MDKTTIQAAIDEWPSIREMLTPSVNYFAIDQEQQPVLALLSVFSARRETWEFLVGAAAYLDSQEFVLESAFRIVNENLDSARDYFAQFVTLPVDDVFSAGFSVFSIMNENLWSESIFVPTNHEDACQILCRRQKVRTETCFEDCVKILDELARNR